jgi:hypothetical protein
VLAKSAVYVARTPKSRALGPFPAPAYSMDAAPRFRSRTVAADKAAPKAIYAAQLPLRRAGAYSVVVALRVGGGLVGAITQLKVAPDSPIREPGERVPAIDTPTVASVGGQIEKIETRAPPDSMHRVSFGDVVGRRPVALLFATPGPVRVAHLWPGCGPRRATEGGIRAPHGVHPPGDLRRQRPEQGLSPPAASLQPPDGAVAITFDGDGRVAARLEGAFGLEEFRRAIEAALGRGTPSRRCLSAILVASRTALAVAVLP